MTSATSPQVGSPSPPRYRSRSTVNLDTGSSKVLDREDDSRGNGEPSASNSHLNPTATFRSVYSPSVSREPSTSRRPSLASHRQLHPLVASQNEYELTGALSRSITGGVPDHEFEAQSRENQPDSRASNRSRRSHFGGHSLLAWFRSTARKQRARRRSSDNRGRSREVPAFVAFPEKKWFKSVVAARIALVFVGCCVSGDIIYKYVCFIVPGSNV